MNNVLRTLIYDGQVSLTVADTSEIVREGIRLHNLSKLSATVFGRTMSAMTFMSSCLKNEVGEISLAVKSDGSCEDIAISGNRQLRLRGYIGNPFLDGDTTLEKQRECLGENGALTIIRDDGYRRPFVGSCALLNFGGVDEAFEEYYRISEQLPTRIATAVEFSEDGTLAFAGVIAVQPLPFADEKTLEEVAALPLTTLLGELQQLGVTACVEKNFLTDKTVWEEREAVYKCNCSREYLTRVLVSLGEEQMREIIKEDGAVKVHCHYCNTDYSFTDEDADLLFAKE